MSFRENMSVKGHLILFRDRFRTEESLSGEDVLKLNKGRKPLACKCARPLESHFWPEWPTHSALWVRTVGSHLWTVLHLVAGFQKFTARNLPIVVFRITGLSILFASTSESSSSCLFSQSPVNFYFVLYCDHSCLRMLKDRILAQVDIWSRKLNMRKRKKIYSWGRTKWNGFDRSQKVRFVVRKRSNWSS